MLESLQRKEFRERSKLSNNTAFRLYKRVTPRRLRGKTQHGNIKARLKRASPTDGPIDPEHKPCWASRIESWDKVLCGINPTFRQDSKWGPQETYQQPSVITIRISFLSIRQRGKRKKTENRLLREKGTASASSDPRTSIGIGVCKTFARLSARMRGH